MRPLVSCADSLYRTIFFFTPARKLLFCAVSIIIALALHNDAFDALSLTTALMLFGARPLSYMISTPLC
jgi:hypothetical protein